jgi:hypothetical protein
VTDLEAMTRKWREWCSLHKHQQPLECVPQLLVKLAKDEREACATIIQGRILAGHYREWPEYGPGNRHEHHELTQFADAMAAAIRERS